MNLPERLAFARALAGISNRELDLLARITVGHSWLIENGRVDSPKVETLVALASALGTTLGWLGDSEGKPPTKKEVDAAVKVARAAIAEVTPQHTPVQTPQQ